MEKLGQSLESQPRLDRAKKVLSQDLIPYLPYPRTFTSKVFSPVLVCEVLPTLLGEFPFINYRPNMTCTMKRDRQPTVQLTGCINAEDKAERSIRNMSGCLGAGL